MGTPSVFTISLTKFIGIGISFGIVYRSNKPILDIYISLPFVEFEIYCLKTKDNYWFSLIK